MFDCTCNWHFPSQAGDTDLNQLYDFSSKAIKVFASSLCNSESILWYNGRFGSEGLNFWTAFSIIITITETYQFHIFLLTQKFLADILSVLAMTMSAEGERVCWVTFVDLCFICSFLKSLCQIDLFVLGNFLAMQFSCLSYVVINVCLCFYLGCTTYITWSHQIELKFCWWRKKIRTVLFTMARCIWYFCLCRLFQESLKYRLLGSEGEIGSWGHEYVRWAASDGL